MARFKEFENQRGRDLLVLCKLQNAQVSAFMQPCARKWSFAGKAAEEKDWAHVNVASMVHFRCSLLSTLVPFGPRF